MTTAFERLAESESAFYKSRFLSPVKIGGNVRVKLGGIAVSFKVRPRGFQGWGIFQPVSANEAAFIETPTFIQQREYLALFPSVLAMTVTMGNVPYAMVVAQDNRFKIVGQFPVQLCDNIQQFDIIRCRYDGENFWYERHDSYHSPALPGQLREALYNNTKNLPTAILGLNNTGFPRNIIDIYDFTYREKQKTLMASTEYRMKTYVERGGGKFKGYKQSGDTYTVEYSVEGETHRSVVDKNFQVVSAGICLNGTDSRFDLQSLMSVMREGYDSERIVRVGANR